MNPFNGFMQAVSGALPGFGDKAGNIGKNVHGLPDKDEAILLSDDGARSFLAWVQNFMDNAAVADTDGESGFNVQPGPFNDAELPALDQLQALIADALDQSSMGGDVSQTMDAKSLKAIIPTREILHDAPEMVAAKENTPTIRQPQIAVNGQPFQTLVPAVSPQAGLADESQIKENTPAAGQTQAAARDALLESTVPGLPTQAGQANQGQKIESPLDWVMTENMPEEGFEKGDAHPLSKPVAPAGDEGPTHTHRLIHEQFPSGLGIAGKATDPATLQLQPIDGQAKDPESMVTGLMEQQSSSSEDDTANSRRQDKRHPAQRIGLANLNEAAWQKDQPSDAVKSSVPEQTQSHPSFQDTAKVLAGDLSTHPADRPTSGPAATLALKEDAAAKTFQTTVMDQIVDKAAMRSIHGRSEIQIRLKPEFLGNVQMNIAADKEQLVVRIMTDRPMVKEIIETHLHQLRTELQNQGLTIDKFEVLVNPNADQQHSRDQFAQMFKHHSSQHGRRQEHEHDPETLHQDGGNHTDDDRPNRDGVNYFA